MKPYLAIDKDDLLNGPEIMHTRFGIPSMIIVEKVVRVVVKVKQINSVTCDISWVCDYETTRLPLSNTSPQSSSQ